MGPTSDCRSRYTSIDMKIDAVINTFRLITPFGSLMLENTISAGNMSLVFLVPNRERGARNLCRWYLTLSAVAVAVA